MNRYLHEVRGACDQTGHGKFRRYADGRNIRKEYFVSNYAWAIPDRQAIKTLKELAPLVEIGAGTGYWASLVEKEGGEVIAFDIDPPEPTYTPVIEQDHMTVKNHPDKTLFMCWPSYAEDWTAEAVEMYDGDTLVYVGEGEGGCTGSSRFHRVVGEEFGLADETQHIPQWDGIRDKMFIFNR
jgi:hypothetical protein